MHNNDIKTRKLLIIWMVIASVYLINFHWHEFLSFCRTNYVIDELITVTWMLIAYWRLQNRDISLRLNVHCLCLFHKLLLTWIKSFCGSNHVWPYSEFEAYQNREVCLCSWRYNLHALFERWLSPFKQIKAYCLKFISSAYLKNCCGQKLPKFLFKNYLSTYNQGDACCLMTSSE